MKRFASRVRAFFEREVDYDKSKKVARHGDTSQRRDIAARQDVAPEILYYLAEDPDPEVRRLIAANSATPPHADVLLTRDINDDVRVDLARKIGRLAPDLPLEARDALQSLTYDALEALASDTLPRVRQIIAEEIKKLDNLPRSLTVMLARDVELMVAAPILEYSPLLRDEDLLEIINSEPIQGALKAISGRHGLSETVSAAIGNSDDEMAIAALLANQSAQISEETLDCLIDRAHDHESWHEPLVLRPHLSERAFKHISRFVTASLLAVLEERHGLAAGLSQEMARRVDERLETPGANDSPQEQAAALDAAGQLTEQLILERLALPGEKEFVIHALARRAALDPQMVQRVMDTASAKSVTALTWKAGLSMRAAMDFQRKLAHIDSKSLLYARDGVDYPMDEEELNWRLDMIAG